MWLICTNIALIALQPLQAAAPPTEVEVRDVRRMLRVVDQDGGEQNTLIELGERVFPIFVIILDSRDLKNVEQSAIFSALSEVKADRSRFLGYALKSLAHKSDMVRASSIHLLEKIGSSRDSAPLVALLSDADSTISRAAAKCLAVIGDDRALIALDVWLSTSSPRKSDGGKVEEQLRMRVASYRDELKARLEKEKQEKKLPPGK